MQSFLNKVALKTIETFPDSMGEATIVLPNRRAIVFLKEEFRKELKSGSWLPRFFSLEDFVLELSDHIVIDQTDLMFELYSIHQQIEGKDAETFHDFLSWANTLLHDFNEIDLNLVDGKDLYSFLTEAKAIEIWNLEGEELSDFQHKYLRFWRSLGKYYELFQAKLRAQKKLYQGLGFRILAEQLINEELKPQGFEEIIFAGFNALTTAEKTIINYFEKEHNALLLWDADEYYLTDSFQEAGHFLRTRIEQDGSRFNWTSNDLLNDEKTIDIYGISGNVGQAKLIGNLLEKDKQEETALVLADEELLVPVLESLPSEVESTNVTMGYALSLSPIYSWIESYILLFKNIDKPDQAKGFYHKDLKLFLEHSICQYLNGNQISAIDQCLIKINQQKTIFVIPANLKSIDDTFSIALFNVQQLDSKNIIESILYLIQILREAENNKLDLLNKECLYELEKTFKRLDRLCAEKNDIIEIQSLIELYRQLVSKQTISFVGEPLGGLQIMGVLESRTLDFKNIIISSVNEGILPSGKTQNSFIPFDIKRKYNLPAFQEKDSIFAYHFYRLLQRAKKISIIYNTKVDQLQGGEKSRFIEQLIHELPAKNPNVKLNIQTISPENKLNTIEEVFINNSDRIREKVLQHLSKGLSPSAFNTFLSCPLDYYYKYVLKLKELDTAEEKVEDSTLGTIVHDCLESLYKPHLQIVLTESILNSILANVETELNKQFINSFGVKAEFGNHKLSYEVAKTFIKSLINYDLKAVKNKDELVILNLEEELSHSFEIDIQNKAIPISLRGKIDRVDTFNGQKRIIDYKTGATQQSDLTYTKATTLLNGNKSKAVQLLVYQYAYMANGDTNIKSGIISLKNISNGFIELKANNLINDLQFILKETIEKMLTDESFIHNSNSKFCTFCGTKKGF